MKLAACIRLPLRILAMLATVAVLPTPPASAQAVIGGKGESDVIVDYSVLEELGPRPNVPQVLMPSIRGNRPPAGAAQPRFPAQPGKDADSASGRITLTPPKGATPHRSAAKPVTRKPKAPAKAVPKPKPQPPAAAAQAPEPSAPPAPPAPPAAKAVQPEPQPAPAPATAAKALEPAPAPSPPAALTPQSESRPGKPPAETIEASTARTPAPPRPTPIAPGQSLRVGFDAGSAKLSPEANRQLKRVAEGMAEDEQLRIQLLAYADGNSDTASQARRLSLSRALAARSFLIGEGVRSTRIDVRALGNKSESGPPDRIDVIVTKR